ncbi:hypothetical protein THOM_2850 [Trachipleistophora hominis]|uniref:Uncharacterized protein n=1 Tax=Trachipleistophora hominis TaxID=72359 RepID=L7JRZ8_TRAHO|nr:hypothetical protein THOM_2850 [Trachipleistophora hominis]
MRGNNMHSPARSSSHASPYNPMTNPYLRQNSFDPFATTETSPGLDTSMPYYISSIL